MNPRERVLAILLGCVIILGGAGFFGYQFVYAPWQKRSKELNNLQAENEKKQNRLAEIEVHRAELARWRLLSLPAETDVARREYEKYLNDMFARHGVRPGYTIAANRLDKPAAAGPNAPKDKEPAFQKLSFTVQADITMASLVGVLEEFYKTGLLHEVKSVSLQRQLTNTDPTKANELTCHLTIEALIVTGAERRAHVLPNIDRRLLAADLAATLQHGPTGLGLVLWASGPSGPTGPGLLAGSSRTAASPSGEAVADMFFDSPRSYKTIAVKNMFLGRPPADETPLASPEWMAPRYVHLTGISTDHIGKTTASLYDVSTNRFLKLRTTTAFDQFSFIRDGNMKAVLRGTLVKIEDRDVTYRAEVAAEDPPASRSGESKAFYRLSKTEREQLVEDKVIKADEAEYVYRVDRPYWESLLKAQVIHERDSTSFRIQLERASDKPAERPADDGGDFGGGDFGGGFGGFGGGSIEVLQGKVIQSDRAELLIRVESRYFTIHLGQSLEDSLKKPLPREQVKSLKVAAN